MDGRRIRVETLVFNWLLKVSGTKTNSMFVLLLGGGRYVEARAWLRIEVSLRSLMIIYQGDRGMYGGMPQITIRIVLRK